jgi:hypothetical protein
VGAQQLLDLGRVLDVGRGHDTAQHHAVVIGGVDREALRLHVEIGRQRLHQELEGRELRVDALQSLADDAHLVGGAGREFTARRCRDDFPGADEGDLAGDGGFDHQVRRGIVADAARRHDVPREGDPQRRASRDRARAVRGDQLRPGGIGRCDRGFFDDVSALATAREPQRRRGGDDASESANHEISDQRSRL